LNQLIEKSSLTNSQACLVELMQKIAFGRIEGLKVSSGQPVINPAPRVIQKLKLGCSTSQQSKTVNADFQLKSEVIDLLAAISRAADGSELSVEVRHGLPTSIDIELPNPIAWGAE
jgi:hypothetical protein